MVAGLLAVEKNLRSEDSFYMKRLDEMLGDPTLVDKETVFTTSENWPPTAVDDRPSPCNVSLSAEAVGVVNVT
ncbi:MAG: hypothetical protein EBY39_13135, partial [Flavobacteriia bacterium]|nr:hypothetical protein [Flavobacteriia bacterium]